MPIELSTVTAIKKTAQDNPALITNLLEFWIDFYRHFSPYFTYVGDSLAGSDSVVERINAGDCGTTALAVGWVHDCLIPPSRNDNSEWTFFIPETIGYWDNYNHAYLEWRDKYYDTFVPTGSINHESMLEYDAPNVLVEKITREELFTRYVLRDRIAARMIEVFCQLFEIPSCPLSVKLLNTPYEDTTGYYTKWNLYVVNEVDKLRN